jgi:hypothetical protein
MEPLNKKERTRVITQFTLAFIAGMLIILIPFWFFLRLPEYEHDIMAKDYREVQKQMKFQKEVFAAQVDTLTHAMARYDMPNQDIDKLNAYVGKMLSDMEQPFMNDTTWSARMYRDIVKAYDDLKKSRNLLLQSQKDLKECKEDLDKAKEEAKKNKDTMGG